MCSGGNTRAEKLWYTSTGSEFRLPWSSWVIPSSNSLISIESTIPKGTSRKVFELVNKRLHVVHVPHRWYASEPEIHGVNQLRVVGGVCDCCLSVAVRFYDGCDSGRIDDKSSNRRSARLTKDEGHSVSCSTLPSLGISLHKVPNIEIAEVTKIAENAHRYLQIAFAEDLYLYCRANQINFFELRDALNSKWYVEILEPRDGIGGHCLPKDTRIFLQSSKSTRSKILKAALKVDQEYRKFKHYENQDYQYLIKNQQLNPYPLLSRSQ